MGNMRDPEYWVNYGEGRYREGFLDAVLALVAVYGLITLAGLGWVFHQHALHKIPEYEVAAPVVNTTCEPWSIERWFAQTGREP
jgi:hypothetical protein